MKTKTEKQALFQKIFFTVNEKKDTLMTAIAKLGGIRQSEVPEFSDSFKEKRQGLPVFNKTGKRAKSADGMVEALLELGYPVAEWETTGNTSTGYHTEMRGNINKLLEAIDKELRGEEVYSWNADIEIEMEADHAQYYDDYEDAEYFDIEIDEIPWFLIADKQEINAECPF